MAPPVPDGSTTNTPLAPSVEKAYYRKCIELKRRLNDVEAANDEAKVRRVRLDRAIQKMRLERAFLLEQLALRMESDYEGSDGSADEQVNTPPPDRPHRDKRRKHASSTAQAGNDSATRPQPSQHLSPTGSPTQSREVTRGRGLSSSNGSQARAVNGTNGEERMDIDQQAGVEGESAGVQTNGATTAEGGG